MINMIILQVKRNYLLIKNVIEQTKFIYSPVGKYLAKHRKTVKNKSKKLIKTIEDHGKQLNLEAAYLLKNKNKI